MNKLLITAGAVGALAFAAPAAAQYANQGTYDQGGYHQGGYANTNTGGAVGVQTRIARLDARIEAGLRSGAIDRNEGRALRQQLRDIERMERQYSRNGLTHQERADLQQRVRLFRDRLASAEGRGGYASNNGYDDRYADPYARNDPYNGRGGPYEDAYCEDTSRGGLAGIIDGIFGGGNTRGSDCSPGLRVGQRASGNLYGVPPELRSRFRDGGGVYYRSDGRSIYQIDARTQTVLRVYAMN